MRKVWYLPTTDEANRPLVIKAANEEAEREKRFRPRPDAFGRTEDETARTFTREALYGEQQTARYRGTGFYAGRRA